MSAFAAGCAICGYDLEAHRAEQQARRDRLPKAPAVSLPRAPRIDDEYLMLGLTAVLVLFVPLFGLILAVVGYRNPRFANARTWFVVLGVIALVILFVPQIRFGIWQLIY